MILKFLALTKPRLTLLSVASGVCGYLLAQGDGHDGGHFVMTLLGVCLIGGGANAFNMVIERKFDAQMKRTSGRPLPTGGLSWPAAFLCALAMSLAGMLILWFKTTPLAGLLGFVTLGTYVLIYTPLKRVTSLNTLVGAIPGALPPLIGYAACAGELGPIIWFLAALLFIWQIPHFLAISWLYREDYRAAGFSMLSVVDDDSGLMTGRQIIVSAAALLPVSLAPTVLGHASVIFFAVAFVLSLGFFILSLAMMRGCREAPARMIFRYSIFYLSVLMMTLVIDRQVILDA